MKQQSIKKNFLLSSMYQVLNIILPFITAPYVARILGADGVGIYGFSNSIQTYFAMFAALGTSAYGLREIARNRNDAEKRSQIFVEIACMKALTGVIVLLAWAIWIIISKEYKIIYIILTLNILASIFDISWFFAGMELFKYTVLPSTVCKLLGFFSIFVFVKKSDDVWIYIFILSATMLVSNVCMWIYLRKYVSLSKLKKIKVLVHFKETMIYFVPTIATSIYTVLDKTLLGVITKNVSENGYYEQATKIIHMAQAVTFAGLNSVMGSRISFLFSEGSYDEIKRKISQSTDFVMFMGIGILFGVLGVANEFVPLYFGEGYDETIYILYVLSPLVVIIGVSNCLGSQYYNPAGLRTLSAKFIIIGAVINLILNLLLIPGFQSNGAAIATIVAESVIAILYLKYCNGFLTKNILFSQAWKKVIAGIIMFVFLRVIAGIFSNPICVIATQLFGGVLVYVLVLLLLKDSVRTVLLSIVKRKK